MRVLIVDDFKLNSQYLARIFSPIAKCDLVDNGKTALFIIKSGLQKKTIYDLICLDLMMPGLDGFEVLKQIRHLEEETELPAEKRAKILVTTALKDGSSVERAIKLGCDGYLAKPYNKKNLKRQLEKMKLI